MTTLTNSEKKNPIQVQENYNTWYISGWFQELDK